MKNLKTDLLLKDFKDDFRKKFRHYVIRFYDELTDDTGMSISTIIENKIQDYINDGGTKNAEEIKKFAIDNSEEIVEKLIVKINNLIFIETAIFFYVLDLLEVKIKEEIYDGLINF